MTKKAEKVTVELYAPWARYRQDLLRIETRAFNGRGEDEEDFEKIVRTALLFAVVKNGDTAVGYTRVKTRWLDTAYIDYQAIDPDYQNKGLLGVMMTAVEEELLKVGFTHIEGDYRINTGYADKVQAHYGDRVVILYDHDSILGPLRFLRIRLDAKRQQEPQAGRQAPNPVSPDGDTKSDEGHSGSLPGT